MPALFVSPIVTAFSRLTPPASHALCVFRNGKHTFIGPRDGLGSSRSTRRLEPASWTIPCHKAPMRGNNRDAARTCIQTFRSTGRSRNLPADARALRPFAYSPRVQAFPRAFTHNLKASRSPVASPAPPREPRGAKLDIAPRLSHFEMNMNPHTDNTGP